MISSFLNRKNNPFDFSEKLSLEDTLIRLRPLSNDFISYCLKHNLPFTITYGDIAELMYFPTCDTKRVLRFTLSQILSSFMPYLHLDNFILNPSFFKFYREF